ncbi:hypothetical protein, conserved [Eimeria praecox]|uniref:Uncharacterized protein n=1 Tax=Eimeria praecox TaxID=51316 RepID=U6H365_9EIME|nr:hypothetical protein, conserved [Eimeria praecox]
MASFDRPALLHVIDALEGVPSEAECQRLLDVLTATAAETKSLSVRDVSLLREAGSKLRAMISERSRLATALRKKMEERKRLADYELGVSKEGSAPDQGRFRQSMYSLMSSELKRKITALDAGIAKRERKLKFYRSKLRTALRQKEQKALSLRLLAQKRLANVTITAKEANALSIAMLIMNRPRKGNYVPSNAEAMEIMKIGSEIAEALHHSRLVLSGILQETSSDDETAACPRCIYLKEHLERCAALQKEADMYILQVRSVLNIFPQDKFKEVMKNLEEGTLQLRRQSELARRVLEARSY